ncbi:MAG: glycoside hydrolase family 65 protein, partial [Bacteroidia bacterium]
AKTVESGIEIAAGASHRLSEEPVKTIAVDGGNEGWIAGEFLIQAEKGKQVWLEKSVLIYTGQDDENMAPYKAVKADEGLDESYESTLGKSRGLWRALWDRAGITIDGDREAQKIIRLHTYHILSTASLHYRELDTGIPPRGLTGEAYRGHIFWDELYILPFFNLHQPLVTRTSLMYRHRRLDEARKNASEHGYSGAMFPWQSGSSGREETQVMHLNPLSDEWGEDYSSLQRHVSLAIAYNLCNYYSVTGDTDFMVDYGAELLYDICRFWSSKAVYDRETDRYHIPGVMGPDEFHEKLPGSNEGGVSDNAYTNIMVSWMLEKAISLGDMLPDGVAGEVQKKLDIDVSETERWKSISKRLALNISEEGIIEQFYGYFGLAELDWDHYRKKYGDIHRLDRILKAEGRSPDEFKLGKQADFLMAFYNLGEVEVGRLITSMGYKLPSDYFRCNFDYYLKRTSHGSTLSRLVHSALAYKLGLEETGWELYLESLRSDLDDIQGGSTGEGIHCGVMAGTILMVISVFCGADFSGDYVSVCPSIPAQWEKVKLNFRFRSALFSLVAEHKRIKISVTGNGKEKIKINICGRLTELETDQIHTINIY